MFHIGGRSASKPKLMTPNKNHRLIRETDERYGFELIRNARISISYEEGVLRGLP